jgi:hypothetical protein
MLSFIARLAFLMFVAAGSLNVAVAQSLDPSGRWALRSLGRPMVIVTLRRDPEGWRGEVERPTTLTADGAVTSLSELSGPRIVRMITSASETPNGLALSIAPAQASAPADIMVLSLRPDGTARLKPRGMPGDGFVLDRARADETLFVGWDAKAEYPIDQHWQTSAEMTRLFEQDQAVRRMPGKIDWTKVSAEDAERRKAARALLDASKLASADDFYHAAFVFQHGDAPEDYLLAHTLALVSIARGKAEATWIAAATFDRYLQAIGQSQVYGTQYKTPTGAEATQDPFDRKLVPDALRQALGVPALAEQEETRKEYSNRP